mmetsp:Transcript_16947/g.40334  ORF Transcript_16947/g.40334 Transcript_16947/m.40334 type:complete len:301 (+) Transcript_16947:929-1831(+)
MAAHEHDEDNGEQQNAHAGADGDEEGHVDLVCHRLAVVPGGGGRRRRGGVAQHGGVEREVGCGAAGDAVARCVGDNGGGRREGLPRLRRRVVRVHVHLLARGRGAGPDRELDRDGGGEGGAVGAQVEDIRHVGAAGARSGRGLCAGRVGRHRDSHVGRQSCSRQLHAMSARQRHAPSGRVDHGLGRGLGGVVGAAVRPEVVRVARAALGRVEGAAGAMAAACGGGGADVLDNLGHRRRRGPGTPSRRVVRRHRHGPLARREQRRVVARGAVQRDRLDRVGRRRRGELQPPCRDGGVAVGG